MLSFLGFVFILASKTLWNAKLYLAEASLSALDDQIFEVQKTLEEYSAEYQEYMGDENARQIIFENAKTEELVCLFGYLFIYLEF